MKKIAQNTNSLQVQVFKAIENAILEGGFAPGESLTEMKLSEELGVSRTPVREALRQLELEGLVKTEPHRGAVVVGISEKDIRDIYIIRSYIEVLAVKWSAENITEEEIEQLREIVELQEFYVAREDYTQIRNLDSKFHELIYASCRSRPLQHMLCSFHHYTHNARKLSLDAERACKTLEEHRRIFEAIALRSGDQAMEYMLEHIQHAKENLYRMLQKEL